MNLVPLALSTITLTHSSLLAEVPLIQEQKPFLGLDSHCYQPISSFSFTANIQRCTYILILHFSYTIQSSQPGLYPHLCLTLFSPSSPVTFLSLYLIEPHLSWPLTLLSFLLLEILLSLVAVTETKETLWPPSPIFQNSSSYSPSVETTSHFLTIRKYICSVQMCVWSSRTTYLATYQVSPLGCPTAQVCYTQHIQQWPHSYLLRNQVPVP